MKFERNEKRKKKNTWIFFYINVANFQVFCWNILLRAKILFMKCIYYGAGVWRPSQNNSSFHPLKKTHSAHCGDLKYRISTNSMWITFISDQFLIFSNNQAKAKKIFQILISKWLFIDYQHYLLQLFSILAHFAFIEWMVNSAWCFREGQNRYL